MTAKTTRNGTQLAPAAHVDARDLEDLRRAIGEWQGAQERRAQAQQQAQQAAEAEVACQGAVNFISGRVRERYGLGPNDQVDPDTGAITRILPDGRPASVATPAGSEDRQGVAVSSRNSHTQPLAE